MAKIDFKKELLDLNGKAEADYMINEEKGTPEKTGLPIMMNQLLARLLANASEGKAERFIPWALTLMSTGVIDITQQDKKDLISFLDKMKTEKRISNLHEYRLLEVLNKVTDKP